MSPAVGPPGATRSLRAGPILLRSAARRMGDAAILFASSAFSVMALAIFAAAASSPRFKSLLPAVETARKLLAVSGSAIAFFVGLSGWFYAEHYLARRKRELASWLLLGMGRGAALRAVSAEFAASSLAALAAGLGLGALFSRFYALVLAALMHERTPLAIAFGAEPLIAASAACAAQWVLSTARAAFAIGKASIVELLKAERAVEEPPRKRPFLAVSGCLLVAGGYACAAFTGRGPGSALILPVLAAVVAGTFLFFAAAAPAFFDAFRARRAGRDAAALVAAAQLSFRSRRNARLLAFASVLVAIAASALGTVLSLRIDDRSIARLVSPHDLELAPSSPEAASRVEALLAEAGFAGAAGARLDLEWIPARLLAGGDPVDVQVFSLSAWNAALRALGEAPAAVEEGRLRSSLAGLAFALGGEDESLVLVAAGPGEAYRETLLAHAEKASPPVSAVAAPGAVLVGDRSYAALKSTVGDGAAHRASAWDGVPDRALRDAGPGLFAAFPAGLVSRPASLDEQGGLYGVLLFIGGFLAAVFTLAAASLVAFRSIEDARDDADRYRSMLRLGAPEGTLRRALGLQNAFAFGLPLGVGLCHSAFALAMLRNLTGFSSLGPALIVSSALALAFLAAGFLATGSQEAGILSRAAAR